MKGSLIALTTLALCGLLDRNVALSQDVAQSDMRQSHDQRELTDAAVSTLLEKLQGASRDERMMAAKALVCRWPPPELVTKGLVEATAHNDAEVRALATAVLGELGICSQEAVAAVVGCMRDEQVFVRERAAASLGKIGPPGAEWSVPPLINALCDESLYVRLAAAKALGCIGQSAPMVIPKLVERLHDPEGEVATEAARALGKFGTAANIAIDALRKALESPVVAVRVNAAAALGGMGEQASEAVPELIRALSDREEQVQIHAAEALRKIQRRAKTEPAQAEEPKGSAAESRDP